MKRKLTLVVMSLLASGLVFADDERPAPVRDLTEQQAYAQNDAAPADVAPAEQTDASADNQYAQQDNQPQQSQPAAPSFASSAGPDVQPDESSSFAGQMTVDQRTARLEAQMNNFVKMNLPARLDDLQQQIQNLNGQLQVVQHDIQLLNQQQRAFYKDLDQRIKQAQNLSGNGSSDSSSAPAMPQTSGNINQKDAAAYQKAFASLKDKNFDQARTDFMSYLNDFPNGQYAANSHYWLGELYMLKNNLQDAGDEFNTVVTRFSSSPKARDARLKLAMVHAKTGQPDLAKKEFKLLKQKYPGTTVAQLASLQLQQMDNS